MQEKNAILFLIKKQYLILFSILNQFIFLIFWEIFVTLMENFDIFRELSFAVVLYFS